jgi:hypothetical protein
LRTPLYTILVALVLARRADAQLRPFGNVYAIVGARIEIGDGSVVEKGDIVVRDGIIESVGPSLRIPPDAEVVKGDGLVVFPGFIDACMTKGLKIPDASADQDSPPDRGDEATPSMREANRKGIRPDIHADAILNLVDGDLTPARKSGFTTALICPAGGLISGYAAIVNLSGKPKREAVVLPDAAFCMSTKIAGGNPFAGGGYPGTILGYFSQIRQTFYDVTYSTRLKSAFDHGSSRRPPSDSVLASIRPVLDGRVRPMIDAEKENDVQRALDLAAEFRLKPVLCLGLEAWKHAARLAKENTPLVLGLKLPDEPKTKAVKEREEKEKAAKPAGSTDEKTPKPVDKKDDKPPNQPVTQDDKPAGKAADAEEKEEDPDLDVPEAAKEERHRLWAEKLANAKRLNEAGVMFALTTRGCKDQKEFFDNLRKAIKDGLPREVALRALTINAARILGVERQLGTVAAGKTANLTVLTKDFTDPKTEARYVFIDGGKFDLKQVKPAPAPMNPFGEGETQGEQREAGR